MPMGAYCPIKSHHPPNSKDKIYRYNKYSVEDMKPERWFEEKLKIP